MDEQTEQLLTFSTIKTSGLKVDFFNMSRDGRKSLVKYLERLITVLGLTWVVEIGFGTGVFSFYVQIHMQFIHRHLQSVRTLHTVSV